MGIKSSFITDYCTQQNFQITEYNLLSIGFQKIQHQGMQTQNPNIHHDDYYQHFHTKKIYKLQNINCNKNQGLILGKALQSLQLNKSQHLCNVVCSSVNSPNILSKTTQIKIFTQSSFLNLVQFTRQKKIAATSPYTNLEISNFIHSLVGILTQIQKMHLPIENIDPFRFLIMKTQADKIKYDIDFSQMIVQHRKINDSRYFSFDILENYREKPTIIEPNQSLWKQNYEKNLVFDFGMIVLHFLLMQPNQDCYNYKTKSLCKSEFEKKLVKLTEVLQERYQKAEQRTYLSKNITLNVSRGSYADDFEISERKSEKSEEQPFQSIIYEMLMGMLCEDIEKRIDTQKLKSYNGKIMEKLKKQYLLKRTENTATSLIEKQKMKRPQIKSTSTSECHFSEVQNQSFDTLNLKKTISAQQMNSTAECLKLSKSRSMITHLKSKRASDRSKLTSDDKQNITDMNLSQCNLQSLKSSIRKLSGYKKVKISQNSYLEGYFENDLAHGLGKITRKNGDIVQCIFHNNQMIQEILPRQSP